MAETSFPVIFKEGTQSPAEQTESKGVEDYRHNNEGYAP